MQINILEGDVAAVTMIAIHIGIYTEDNCNLYYGLFYNHGTYHKEHGWNLNSTDAESYRLFPPFNKALFTENCRHGYASDASMVKASLTNQKLFEKAFPDLLKYLTKVKTCR